MTVPAALFAVLLTFLAAPAVAQPPQPVEPPRTQGQQPPAAPMAARPYEEPNAEQTRERLRNLLRQHPTTVQEVFKLDPALLNDANYMAPYPALAAFVQAHPEIVRNPRYFLGLPATLYGNDSADQSVDLRRAYVVRDMFAGMFFLIGFLAVAGIVAWGIKAAVDYRRWLRLSKIQMETHTKLVDRFTSNEDLLAYIQTPAGRRFLESGPVSVDSPKSISAPHGRILWALQAGTVMTVLGAGFLYASRTLAADPEIADASPFVLMLGTVAVALGIGFVLSAFLSYLVSRRLGLINGHPVSASSHA